MDSGGLTRRDVAILRAMYELSQDGPEMLAYEDIVVKAWLLDKDEFGLRGYSEQYPDASDIHKRLYATLKSRGYVASGPRGRKSFSLTPTGWSRAREFFDAQPSRTAGRLSRSSHQELSHLEKSAANRLVLSGEVDGVLDTDFFGFYRTSVRAKPADFEQRLAEVELALADAEQKHDERAPALRRVDRELREKFAGTITAMTDRRR